MTNNYQALRLQMSPDARLAAAAGAVARFLADGDLPEEAIAALQKAIVAACRAACEELSETAHLALIFERHADRVEVVIPRQLSAALRLDRVAAAASSGVDRIQHETQHGQTVMRVVKYLGSGPHAA